MKKNVSRILLLVLLAAALLCVTAVALADECAPGTHNLVEVITLKPTCEKEGKAITKCTICGYVVANSERTVSKLPHDYTWVTDTPAQCQVKGREHQVCKVCSSIGEYRDITALDHDWGPWTVTKAATCTEMGTEVRICKLNASHKQDRDIDKLGHDYGPQVTTPATCVAPGSVKQVCRRDSSHVISTEIPINPDAHDWGAWTTVKKPNCTDKGMEKRVCKRTSAHYEERELPVIPDAHDWDKGTVIKKPTFTEEGEKKYTCKINPEHVKFEKMGTQTLNGNTVCAFGPRLRDVNLYPYDTDLWYMFTPFDASQDGVQTYELVASNKYIVGNVKLTIKDGNLRIDYTLNETQKFKITLEFFTVLNRIGDLTQYEPEELLYMRMNKNQDISLADFGEDTSLVLYFCSRCDYTNSAKYLPLDYDSNTHQRLLRSMLELMD